MDAFSLLEEVQSGSNELKLHNVVRFRRRRRRNHCSFDDFLVALQQSRTIEMVNVVFVFALGLSVSQWFQLLRAFGSMPRLRALRFMDSRGLHQDGVDQPNDGWSIEISLLANLLQNATKLQEVEINWCVNGDSDDLPVLANALRQHSQLSIVSWGGSLFIDGSQSVIDPVLRSLGECPTLKLATLYKCGNRCSSEGLNSLVRSTSFAALAIEGPKWDVVADYLSATHCLLRRLCLFLNLEQVDQTELGRFAAAIEGNSSLCSLYMNGCDMFTAANCAALAKAFTVNCTLHSLSIQETRTLEESDDSFQDMVLSSRRACQSFSRMLQVNFRLELCVEVPSAYRETDEFKDLEVQLALNSIGRGRLQTGDCTRTDWVDALRSAKELDPPLVLDCLYSIMKMNPLLCHRGDNN